MLDRLDETIVAISSAPGWGPVGIVRLSGPTAITIADRMFDPAAGGRLRQKPGFTRHSGEIRPEPGLALPADLYMFRAPHSYTRGDLVEIHTVGSPSALELVVRRTVALGAVAAQPGEFTARAFVNGAVDLASAEAVAGVIRAESDTQLRASRRMMDGALARRLMLVRKELTELVALVEADIDFTEEAIEFVRPKSLCDRLAAIDLGLRSMLAESQSAEQFNVLPQILLLGPPNAGKSSLLNRLSGTSRAICAAVAGTTRDVLSAPIRLGRGEAMLLDAAGVDQSQERLATLAREMALSTTKHVDAVCVVLDVSAVPATLPPHAPVETTNKQPSQFSGRESVTDKPPAPSGLHRQLIDFVELLRSLKLPKTVVAANKSDLLSGEEGRLRAGRLEGWRLGPVCLVSARDGSGTDDLLSALGDALADGATTTLSDFVLLSERQRLAITEGCDAIVRAKDLTNPGAKTIDQADLLAFELREALDALGTVTGAVTTDDLLNQIFADFCIGK